MLQDGQRLFGTDGVRGIANLELDATFALDLARSAGEISGDGPVVIGRDTRRSGEMLNASLQAGFHSVGIDTCDVGVIPVGGVSALIPEMGATLGVMVSASHNPAQDNGIKFFNSRGDKLTDEREDEIEARLRSSAPWKTSYADKIGTRFEVENARARYLKTIHDQAEFSFGGMRLALDCAHGAAYRAAPELFTDLKADIDVHFAEPTGMNINDGCGATHPEVLASVADGRIGLCFDGDADRLFVVDENGEVANGDVIMAIIAHHLKDKGKLKNNLVVATVMSNLGFRQSMERAGIELVETKVGDRYVLESMLHRKAALGGEQSGHVIQLDRGRTGDGLQTAVRLLEVVASTGREIRDLRRDAMVEFPQVLKNVRVGSKERLSDADGLWQAIQDAEDELGDEGRVLVRASGTEPLVRVMVEADTAERAQTFADSLAAVVVEELKSDE
jgi:phosphoglucosamine mutase